MERDRLTTEVLDKVFSRENIESSAENVNRKHKREQNESSEITNMIRFGDIEARGPGSH